MPLKRTQSKKRGPLKRKKPYEPGEKMPWTGACRESGCSCPGFAGNDMYCKRDSCRHHWTVHELL